MCVHPRLVAATPWTAAHQAPLSMGLSRLEYWSGLPCPPHLGGLPSPGIGPTSLVSPALVVGFFTTSTSWKAQRERQMSSNFHLRKSF